MGIDVEPLHSFTLGAGRKTEVEEPSNMHFDFLALQNHGHAWLFPACASFRELRSMRTVFRLDLTVS
ncbi:MAG TPA: hypothetical protein VGV14_16880, partial [Rhodanobacter sp.]|nr:hypothetical protein [Rhodanobacter sp.]